MPCLIFLLALLSPRLALVATWLFTGWLGRAYDDWWLPLLGFLFLPWTTLAYAVLWQIGAAGVSGIEWFFVVLAFLADLGAYGGATRGRGKDA